MKNRLLFVVGLAVFGMGCGSEPEVDESEPRPPLVETVAVAPATIPLSVYTSGRLASKAEVRLSFKIGGIVGRMLVDEGRSVKKGQLLAQLDLAEIQAQVRQAKSALDKAWRDRDRVEALRADKVATLEQVQDATTALEVAQSNWDMADFNLRHASIYAPASGKILKRFAEQGELVGPGSPVLMFGSTSRDWVLRVGVADRDVVRLRIGDPAAASFDAYPGRTFAANVTEIAGAADPMSGTYEVELRVDADGQTLLSGFVASVTIEPTQTESLIAIPPDALIGADGDAGFVYVMTNDRTVKRTPVQIGRLMDDAIGIRSGLDAGQRVITTGAAYLKEGMAVRVISDGDTLPVQVGTGMPTP